MPYIIAVVIAVVLALGFTFFQSNKTPSQTSQPTPITQNNNATYKDGTYKTSVTYHSPSAGDYSMDVTLTLAKNIVTNSNIIYGNGAEKDPYPKNFDEAYKTEVVGKNMNNISLSRIGGATLTTDAFNKALTTIKTQAQS